MKKHLTAAIIIAVMLGIAAYGSAMAGNDKPAAKNSEFVGSTACAKCHKVEYDSWKQTYHSKMVQAKDDGMLKAAVEKWKTDGTNAGPSKGNVTGKTFGLNDVEMVVGSYWKQRYLVKDESTGHHQFLDKQFNRMSGKWEPYGNKNDWEFMCATCHTTGYRITQYDEKNLKAQKASWSETNVSCEACHGPGAKHVKNPKAKGGIWDPAKAAKSEQSRACGYCHIRLENELYKTPQGNNREDFPAPKIDQTFKPWDDWTKWYPEHVIVPGVQADDKVDAAYKGDLQGLFILDEKAKKNGVYEEAKHHQQYQGFIQSKHHKNGILSCNDCHMPHAGKKIEKKVAKETCKTCHGDAYTYDKIMPGTGGTAKDLTVRTHTFFKEQDRASKPTVSGNPEYLKK